jgi:hypothetical protein
MIRDLVFDVFVSDPNFPALSIVVPIRFVVVVGAAAEKSFGAGRETSLLFDGNEGACHFFHSYSAAVYHFPLWSEASKVLSLGIENFEFRTRGSLGGPPGKCVCDSPAGARKPIRPKSWGTAQQPSRQTPPSERGAAGAAVDIHLTTMMRKRSSSTGKAGRMDAPPAAESSSSTQRQHGHELQAKNHKLAKELVSALRSARSVVLCIENDKTPRESENERIARSRKHLFLLSSFSPPTAWFCFVTRANRA